MQTITDKLQILKDNTESIRQALSAKAGYDVGPMLKDYPDIIENIKGGAARHSSDVTFYDYDGAIFRSYEKDEFLTLTALPELPSHDGLVCQGWNWVLEDAKEYVQEYGRLDIGATYITDDNKTRLYINLLNDGMSVPLYINQPASSGVTVDWGDGTNTETVSDAGNLIVNHTYNKAGSYIISLKVETGTCTLGHNNSPYNVMGNYDTIASGSLYKVEIGSNMNIGGYAFQRCYSLSSLVLPNSLETIDRYAFMGCYSLQSVTIPNFMDIKDYAFYNCTSLTSITIPNSVTIIMSFAFYNCYNLSSLVLPNSVTSIGGSAFTSCTSLTSITIPNSVTRIEGNAFAGCLSMQYCDFTSHTSIPTLSNTNAFAGINAGCEIRVPAALYNDWVNATNWSNCADYIVPYNENGEKVTL